MNKTFNAYNKLLDCSHAGKHMTIGGMVAVGFLTDINEIQELLTHPVLIPLAILFAFFHVGAWHLGNGICDMLDAEIDDEDVGE